MSFLKLLLSFAPWISFLIIAQGSLLRLKIGLIVALLLSIAMGVAKLHRGVILWVGLAFFTYAAVAVVMFKEMWTVRHMGVLANGALAAASWFTVVAGKPFRSITPRPTPILRCGKARFSSGPTSSSPRCGRWCSPSTPYWPGGKWLASSCRNGASKSCPMASWSQPRHSPPGIRPISVARTRCPAQRMTHDPCHFQPESRLTRTSSDRLVVFVLAMISARCDSTVRTLTPSS